MNAIGIICEYNPFHLGHARMLEGLRRQYDAPLVLSLIHISEPMYAP